MSKIELALSAWIAFHAKIGINIEPTLMPPATEEDILTVEKAIGYRLPEDLRELYKLANGQYNPYDHAAQLDARLATDEPWAPFFGHFEFFTIGKGAWQTSRLRRDVQQRKGV